MMGIGLKLDNTDTRDYDIYLRERLKIPTPEQDIEHIEIKGRHGSLTKKYGYKDIPLSVKFYFYENTSFKKAFRVFKMFLLMSKELMSNDDESVFYKIKSVKIEESDNDVLNLGEFTVTFILDPFQYEADNDTTTYTSSTTITNPGFELDPIIEVTASGTGKLHVNDQTVQIKDINGTITIDSEMKNAYRDENGSIENLNSHMVGDFPILENGKNKITFDGDISKIKITKRLRWV